MDLVRVRPWPLGKTGSPVIGETLEFLNSPKKFIRERMAKYSRSVFRTNIIMEQYAVICGVTGNKLLFSNKNKLVEIWKKKINYYNY